MQGKMNASLSPVEVPKEGDFHLIPGIGPGIEQRLHAAGIVTFDQLARLSPEEITAALHGLVGITPERIQEQNWCSAAARLAEPMTPATPPADPTAPGERQHYETFHLELLMDESCTVRRTRLKNLQTNAPFVSARWDPDRMIDWIAEQIRLASPGADAAPEVSPTPEAAPQAAEPPAARKERLPWRGELIFNEVQLFNAGNMQPGRLFTANQPIEIRLWLHLALALPPAQKTVICRVDAQAHRLGSDVNQHIGHLEIQISAAAEIPIAIPTAGLPVGAYHLEVQAMFFDPEDVGAVSPLLAAYSDIGLIQVIP
jgi:hypothetical protein